MTEGTTADAKGRSSGEHGLEVRRVVAHPPEKVFDAWTDPEAMVRWMRPRPGGDAEVELDPRPGGRVRIDMIHGGTTSRHVGEVLEVDRPRRLAITWAAEWLPTGSVVSVDFHPVEGGTEVVLRHTGLPDESSRESHEASWTDLLLEVERQLEAGIGEPTWIDLTVPSDRAEAIRDFYDRVVGWRPEPVSMGEYDDYNMTDPADGTPRAGVCRAAGPNAALPPVWLVYFRVADLDHALAQVERTGGSVVSGPRAAGSGRYAVIRDPDGTVCALAQGG